MKTWQVIEASVANEALEAVEYGLMEAGALGTEAIDEVPGRVRVAAYFEDPAAIETARAGVEDALRIYGFEPAALLDFHTREIADQDWLTEWKKHWRPVEVGRFVIAPPWLSGPAAAAKGSSESPAIVDPVTTGADTIVIQINPGMAFGTGTHETTRLCLKAIEKYYAGGSFLDVGTGTGVLAIAAAKLGKKTNLQAGPRLINACDSDAEAIAIAKENADLNQVAGQIDFQVGSINDQTPSADLVCANLTAPVIVELLPLLLGVTCGRLILSGVLDSQFESVHARLLEQGATVNEITQDGEWIALVI